MSWATKDNDIDGYDGTEFYPTNTRKSRVGTHCAVYPLGMFARGSAPGQEYRVLLGLLTCSMLVVQSKGE